MMEEKDQSKEAQEGQQPSNPDSNDGAVSNDLAEKLAEAEKQASSYKDLFLRKAAEFDNFKRRTEQELGSVIRFANDDLVRAILPVVDDLERSLKNAKESSETPLYKGIELILQKMLKILESQGVKSFETVGKDFDVHFHDALLQMPKEGVPPHTILEEVEKGYLFHDKVLRHAKVIVSASGDPEQAVHADPNNESDSSEG